MSHESIFFLIMQKIFHHRGKMLRKTTRGLVFSSIILSIAIFALWSKVRSAYSPKKHIFIITETTLQELPILRAETAFDQRLQEFLSSDACEPHFFMTWISPAPLFRNRQTLALETLFKSHPNSCLVILSDTLDSPTGNRILQPLSGLGFRILPISPDIPLLLRHTPALDWYSRVKTGEIDVGQIPFSQNLSNLLRLAVLYRYGGVYLDTDFIVLRSLSGLRNSLCAQSINPETGEWWRLNNAALIFDKQHPLLLRFIQEFVNGFDGNKWGHNGPYLVSRVVESVTNGGSRLDYYNFTVLPPVAFYPVDWTKISTLFKRPKTTAHRNWARAKLAQLKTDERSYGLHLWNKQTSVLRIEEGSVIARLISDRCLLCKHIFAS